MQVFVMIKKVGIKINESVNVIRLIDVIKNLVGILVIVIVKIEKKYLIY